MSREALAIGSDTKPPVLFRGDYSQWKDRFEDFIERQHLGDLILKSYKEGPATCYIEAEGDGLHSPSNISTPAASRQYILLKDKSKLSQEETERVRADRLARSYLLQGVTNEIYTHVDSYKDAKPMWDEIAKQMQGSELSSRAKITKVLTNYENFKASEGELLFDTYNRYCNLLNDLRRNGITKHKLEMNIKFLKNLQPEWKKHAMSVIQNKDLTDLDIHDVFECMHLHQEDVSELEGAKTVHQEDPLALIAEKRQQPSRTTRVELKPEANDGSSSDEEVDEVVKAMALLTSAMQRKFFKKPSNNQLRTSSFTKRSDYQSRPPYQSKPESSTSYNDKSKADSRSCYNCKKSGHIAKDCRAPKIRDSNYYKTKMLLAKQEESGSALLADDAEWLTLTDEENEDCEVNLCLMGKMSKVQHNNESDAPVLSDSDNEVHSKLFQQTYEKIVTDLATNLQKQKDKAKLYKLKFEK